MTQRVRTGTGVDLVVTDAMLQAFLDEDLGVPPRDVSSDGLFPEDARSGAAVVTRRPTVVSGLAEALRVFGLCGATGRIVVADGQDVAAGAVLAEVEGHPAALLRAERTALNILGRMSGIATLTSEVQARVHKRNPACRVAATRKTTPGFRVFEKLAVVHGGGDPHRFGLFDQVLVKDNHRAAAGDLGGYLDRIRSRALGVVIEVEVETKSDAEAAARGGADWILVDNQPPARVADIAAGARAIRSDIRIEASGGITPENAADFAPFVDRVSLGMLTQGARAADVSLEWRDPA